MRKNKNMSYQVADYRSRTIGLEPKLSVSDISSAPPNGFDITMIIVLLLLVAAFVILLLVLSFRKPSTETGGNGPDFTTLKVVELDSARGSFQIVWDAPKATKVSISPTLHFVNPVGASALPPSGYVQVVDVKSQTYTVTATDAKGNTKKQTIRVVNTPNK